MIIREVSRISAFLGKPFQANEILKIYSPTIEEVEELGEGVYYTYLHLALFDKEVVLKNLFEVDDDTYEELEDFDDFISLVSFDDIAAHVAKGISFFTKKDVQFDPFKKVFLQEDNIIINYNNYESWVKALKILNGISAEKKKVKLKTKRAKSKLKRMQEMRNKYGKKNDAMELKDILSVLCNAEGNGINVFNVGKLTIYQVYEHFERLNMKEGHDQVLRVWANGLLEKNSKVPEWIARTKL